MRDSFKNKGCKTTFAFGSVEQATGPFKSAKPNRIVRVSTTLRKSEGPDSSHDWLEST